MKQMNLSWNYTKCNSNYFNYCGDENLAEWLEKQGMEPNEIESAIKVADEYIEELSQEGRDCSCVV